MHSPRFRVVQELAAVAETVGRDVEDADHLRLVEPDGPFAELERGVDVGQVCPL